MIKYLTLGAGKCLNEIVVAGSHDAGITTGGGNAQTQVLDIYGQADAGVRFFDIRVAAFATGNTSYGAKQAEIKAFHAAEPILGKTKATSSVVGFSGKGDINVSNLRMGLGTEGMGLRQMLLDAKKFVEAADTRGEFLILKFDKCTNWGLIADLCRATLDNCIYTGGGNLNTTPIGQLSGKVICAFMPSGYSDLKTPQSRVGITAIKNLYKPPAGYDMNFHGLQYWGAGGTSPWNNKNFDEKRQENIAKQRKIISGALTGVKDKKAGLFGGFKVTPGCAAADPKAVGMMYWTTTGMKKSILDRDASNWNDANRGGLQSVWQSGFDVFMGEALPSNIKMSRSSAGTLKMFMPNIVMIDFADETKCKHIYELNDLAAARLVDICQRLGLG
ncbi:hypothetical protein [Rhodanobacter sp. B05]|uniref:hypothetical protein n=1 Tax=Rhodanobacter sp. B05 TaxID=1945859 RepID=UPI00111552B6|nr:hypothetical protein [Rhodanobacter sp. B05]